MKIEIGLIAISFFIICGIIIGWFGNLIYFDYTNKKTFDGLWIPRDNLTHAQALRTAYNYSVGSWVCVNIKGMDVERMVEVCQHEVGHELFAEKCENNVTRCLEAVS